METQEQRAERHARELADLGFDKIIKLNSRARTPFRVRLARGVVNLSPLALIFAIGYAATWATYELIEWMIESGYAEIIGGFIVKGLGL